MEKRAGKVLQQRGSVQKVASGDEAFTAAHMRHKHRRSESIESTRTSMHTFALVF